MIQLPRIRDMRINEKARHRHDLYELDAHLLYILINVNTDNSGKIQPPIIFDYLID